MDKSLILKEFKDLMVATLEDNKAEDIIVVDLKNKTDIADYMIIATGRSSKHVSSTADNIIEKVKELDLNYHIEGMPNSEWVLIDLMDIIIHLFSKEKRQLYALEQLWQS